MPHVTAVYFFAGLVPGQIHLIQDGHHLARAFRALRVWVRGCALLSCEGVNLQLTNLIIKQNLLKIKG